MATLKGLQTKATELFENKEYEEVIALLTDMLEKFKDAGLYALRARAEWMLDNDPETIMLFAQKATDADPSNYLAFIARGNAWFSLKSYDKAITDYSTSIQLRKENPIAYYYRGNTWMEKKNFDKAISDYDQSINMRPDFEAAYYNRANLWSDLNDYEKAIAGYTKTIELDIDYENAYYNRANIRRKLGKDLEGSIKDYEKYLELTSENDDVWTARARNSIKELEEKIKDAELNEIGEITSKIKKLLLVTKGCITHYTGLGVSKKLILDPSNKFRISEGAFLNDTSEGTEIFKFLDYQFYKLEEGLIAETFAPKPFIGSFVAENKHDDLNLWRFYGKENGVEAKGCALTLRMKEFIEAINRSITGDTRAIGNNEDDINFYRVAYLGSTSGKVTFQIPNSTKKNETDLNALMKQLKEKVAKYKAVDKSILEKYINSIAFLFKSDAYKNENELRLVIKGIEFEKKFDVLSDPPRVYIELINIRNLIEQITLGPKVDKPDEWAAAFFYSFDTETDETKKPKKILISRLPYK